MRLCVLLSSRRHNAIVFVFLADSSFFHRAGSHCSRTMKPCELDTKNTVLSVNSVRGGEAPALGLCGGGGVKLSLLPRAPFLVVSF